MDIIRHGAVTHQDEKGRPQTIFTLGVNSDDTMMVTGSLDSTVSFWVHAPCAQGNDNAMDNTGENNHTWTLLTQPLSRHEGAVLCARFHPLNPLVCATGGDDKRVLLWSVDTVNKLVRVLASSDQGHTSDVTAVAWSDCGQFLLSGSLDKSVCVYRVSMTGSDHLRLLGKHAFDAFVKGLAVSGDNLCVVTDDKAVHVMKLDYYNNLSDTAHVEKKVQLVKQSKQVFPMASDSVFFSRPAFSPDSTVLAVPNGCNGPILACCLLDVINGSSTDTNTVVSLIGHYGCLEVASFSPCLYGDTANGTLLALGGQDGTVSIWSSLNTHPLLVLSDLSDSSVTDIQWLNDGSRFLVSFYEGIVVEFSLSDQLTGKPKKPLVNVKDSKLTSVKREELVLKDQTPNIPAPGQKTVSGKRRITPMLVSVNEPRANAVPLSANTLTTQGTGQIQTVITVQSDSQQRFPKLETTTTNKRLLWIFKASFNNHRVVIEVKDQQAVCSDGADKVYWRDDTLGSVDMCWMEGRVLVIFNAQDRRLTVIDGRDASRLLPRVLVQNDLAYLTIQDDSLLIIDRSGQMMWFLDSFSRLIVDRLPKCITVIESVSLNPKHLFVNHQYTLTDQSCWLEHGQVIMNEQSGNTSTVDTIKRLCTSTSNDSLHAVQERAALQRLLLN